MEVAGIWSGAISGEEAEQGKIRTPGQSLDPQWTLYDGKEDKADSDDYGH